MPKKFFGSKTPIFWTIAEQLPSSHVEDLIKDWYGLNSNIEWDFPNQELRLIATDLTQPTYIKATDGLNRFYFYYVGINDIVAYKDGKYWYTHVYKLDEYMTIYFDMLQDVLAANPNVQFIKKFYDRFIYEPDETGYISTAKINFFEQVQYLKAPVEPVALVRKYVYGSTADSLYDKQRVNGVAWAPLPQTLTFAAWDHTNHFQTISSSELTKANLNKRFTYLVLKSSAKMGGAVQQADNDKLIVPLLPDRTRDIIDYLFNFDITGQYPCMLNVGSDNVVGFFESEVPPSLIAGAGLNGEPVLNYVGYNADNYEHPVVFFQVPHNYAFQFILSSSNENGLSEKLLNIFKLAQSDWSPDTEPLFLSDNYYKELHGLNQNDRLETAMSLINFSVTGTSMMASGINVHSYEFFDNTATSTYFYTDNNDNDCTNPLNPIWNSNKSNRTTSLSLSAGLYDSASANYYSTNSATQYTSVQNRKSEQEQSWIDYGADTAKKVINSATSFNIMNPVKSIGNVAQTAISIATGAIDNTMSNQRANRQLAANLQNIATSPASTVSSPYVSVCVPNNQENGNTLFNTYALECSDFDKNRVFITIANQGYPTNDVAPIASFINRQKCNILHISTYVCQNQLWNLLINRPQSIFNNQIYNARFLAWLNTPHMFYRTNRIGNYFDPQAPDYEANLEIKLAPFPSQLTDIGKLIDDFNLGLFASLTDYTDEVKWQILTNHNPRLADALSFAEINFVNVPYDQAISLCTIAPKPTTAYTGVARFTYNRPTVKISDALVWTMADSFTRSAAGVTSFQNITVRTRQTYETNNINISNISATASLNLKSQDYTNVPVTINSTGVLVFTRTFNINYELRLFWGTISNVVFTFTDDLGNTANVALTADSKPVRPNFVYARTTQQLTVTVSTYDSIYTGGIGFYRTQAQNDTYSMSSDGNKIINILTYAGINTFWTSPLNGTSRIAVDGLKDYATMNGADQFINNNNVNTQLNQPNGWALMSFLMSDGNNPVHVYIGVNTNHNW